MATHTKNFNYSGNEGGTDSTTLYYNNLGLTNVYAAVPNYGTITNITFSIEWKTSLREAPGDLYVELANNRSDIINDNYVWRSSKHQSYKEWETFTTAIPPDKFLQVKGKYEVLVVEMHSFVTRHYYWKSPILTITYVIPDITYTYKNWDGTVLKTETVEEGTQPTPPTNPTRPSTPEYTYSFNGWSLSGTTYTAQYTSSTDGNGSVSGGGTYEYGSAVTLTAVPNAGYKFKQWSNGIADNPRSVTVTGNATYTAEFEQNETIDKIYVGSNSVGVYCGDVPVKGIYIGTKRIYG